MPWKVLPGNPVRQGLTRTETGFNFAVRVPDGEEASLLLYRKGSGKVEFEIPLPEEERVGEVSAVRLEPMEAGRWEYNYRLSGTVVPDVYAKRLVGREKFKAPLPGEGREHEIRGGLCERPLLKTQPLHIPYEDTVIYKTHVRGFTRHGRSRVRNKGTFAGITEKITYLLELGVTALELMPVYEFFEILPDKAQAPMQAAEPEQAEKVNYWGYGPALYFAPKASFSATGDPVKEFAGLVDSLHEAGIECILEFYFPAGTNAGLVLDVLHYWQLNFGVDGFHLLGDGEWVTLAAQDPLLKKTKLIYLGYDTTKIYGEKRRPFYKNLGEHNLAFQQELRKFLKGDEGCVENAALKLRRNPAGCGVINYFSDHDGFTMADMVSYEHKHNEANGEGNRDGSDVNYTWNCGVEGPSRKMAVRRLRMRQMRNAWMMLMTAQGTPMIYGGDEFCNSAGGNNNSYCQDNEVGWLDWNRDKASLQMTEFVKKCVDFRKRHPVLHMAEEPRLMDYKSYGCPDLSYHGERAWYTQMEYTSRILGEMYCGSYAHKADGSDDDYIYIAYNMYWNPQKLALPTLPDKKVWKLAASSDLEEGFFPQGQEEVLSDQRGVVVPARTVIILIAGRDSGLPPAGKDEVN